MNARKLLGHIAIGGALIIGWSYTSYAASEDVDAHSLSGSAHQADTAPQVSSTVHGAAVSSTSSAHDTQGNGVATSSLISSSVIVPKALLPLWSAPVSSAPSKQETDSSNKVQKTEAPVPAPADTRASSPARPADHPALTPTGYIEALIAPLSVARDLGKNCQHVLSSNTGDQDICDQFDRAVDNLAQDQAKIEKTTPRPKDTKSVDPALMSHFNQLSQQLNQEVQYLRAYRATQK